MAFPARARFLDIARYQDMVARGIEPRFAAAAIGASERSIKSALEMQSRVARKSFERRRAALLPELKERLRRDILNDIA